MAGFHRDLSLDRLLASCGRGQCPTNRLHRATNRCDYVANRVAHSRGLLVPDSYHHHREHMAIALGPAAGAAAGSAAGPQDQTPEYM